MKRFSVVLFCLVALPLIWPTDGFAQKRSRKATQSRAPIEVKADVAVGPAGFVVSGPVADDQTFHFGLRLSVAAIIEKETVRANASRVPRRLRKAIARMDGPLRIYPFWWLPNALILAPKVNNTGIFGINFRPFGLGLVLANAPRVDIGAGLNLTYAYVTSTAFDSPTHFLRPGLDLKAQVEVPLADSFLVSVGWASTFYPPQQLGGSIVEFGDLDSSIWHIGQLFLQFHFRFPYKVNL